MEIDKAFFDAMFKIKGDGKPVNLRKYVNKDKRCRLPIDPENPGPLEYCWSFAHHVDGTKGYEDIQGICDGTHENKKKHGSKPCEEWEENHE